MGRARVGVMPIVLLEHRKRERFEARMALEHRDR
jgi:hypothetical protein